ncbi:MAG TPA: glutamate-cysteine ligase family protein [Polyangiaceae bacterium]|nr:glutamate-cysteine ligase family protein [Polyangiaceae bacterium]
MSSDRLIRTPDDLLEIFHASEKPASRWRVGAESEKFGVLWGSCAPLPYQAAQGVASVEALFNHLRQNFNYQPYAEREGGPVIGLHRGGLSITLEPSCQFELSGEPLSTVHEIANEFALHFQELRTISNELAVQWLGVGFHPFAQLSELPWVPKERYPIMKAYLPQGGARALDMMQRTATVQANFDFSSEEDALRKLCTSLRLSPIIQAMTANAPFIEGRVSEKKSERADVWLHMPKDRSGLIPQLWRSGKLGYRDYAEWALDAGMFLFKRGEVTFKNAGQTFRDFMHNGFQGERAMLSDWALHLNTLFPEARLKSTLEVRSCDSQGQDLLCAVPALYTGLLYDEQALSAAEAIANTLTLSDVEQARPELVRVGLQGKIGRQSVQRLAEAVLAIAQEGLGRRARLDAAGRDESRFLVPLSKLLSEGKAPADALIEGLNPGQMFSPGLIAERTRIGLSV